MYDPESPLLRGETPSKGMPEPLAKARFAEDRLLDAVVACEIAPGETITEAQVMERFGLTRAAARAALTRLGYDEWARPQARLGWEVLPVTGNLIGQVLEARRVVEPAALSRITLDQAEMEKLETLGGMIDAVRHQTDPDARAALGICILNAEDLLLNATDDFTARQLRKLWRHSARIARHMAVESEIESFRRDAAPDLVAAILAGDRPAIAAAREALIDMQQAVFLREILKNDAALGPGSGTARRPSNQTAANNGRPI